MSETIFDSKDYPSLFKWPEYIIFSVILGMSMGIGIFFGFFNKKNSTDEDFLVGGRSMSVFPVTLSLVCSFISGVALLGDPVEVYYYGLSYIFFYLAVIPMIVSVAYLYVPVFYRLKLTSAYEYLEMRFDRNVRLVISCIGVIHLILYMPLTVWAPSLALDQVAGLNKYLTSAVIFIVCIIYSSIGGLKAVLWSDALQGMVMFGSVVAILFVGIDDMGGLNNAWNIAREGGRTEIWKFDADPRTRYTFWSGFVGAYFFWLALFAGTQGQIQRYLSVPTLKKAQLSLLLSLFGLIFVQLPSMFLGIVIYAKYVKCDPISVDAVSSSDQLLPLYIMDTMGNKTGLPGLMVAGLTCASLSSVSSALNAIPAIIVEDYVKAYYPHLSATRLGYISKIVSGVAGTIAFALIFVIAAAGSIVPFSALLHGLFLGPSVGVFTLAFFFPWANSIGSILGVIFSMILTLVLGIGSTINGLNDNLPNQKLPLSIEECYVNGSGVKSGIHASHAMSTGTGWKEEEYSGIIDLFSVSYLWQPAVAVVGTVTFGLLFSIIVNMVVEAKHPIKAVYMSPLIVKMWRKVLSDKAFHYWIQEEEDEKEDSSTKK